MNSTTLEALLRDLQSRAGQITTLLEALLPPRQAFEQRWQQNSLAVDQLEELFDPEFDLFTPQPQSPAAENSGDPCTAEIYRWWQTTLQTQPPAGGLCAEHWQNLVSLLLDIARKQSLEQQITLRLRALPSGISRPATTYLVLSEFISWLGYIHLPAEQRPLSRINPGLAIFVPRVLTRPFTLQDKPRHAATEFVYDWLVAFQCRAKEVYQKPS